MHWTAVNAPDGVQTASQSVDAHFTGESQQGDTPMPNADRTAKYSRHHDSDTMQQRNANRANGSLQNNASPTGATAKTEATKRPVSASDLDRTFDRADSPMPEAACAPVRPPNRPSKARAAKEPALSLYVAKVEETAARVSGSTDDLSHHPTFLRIQKMLSRAEQRGANESEAKTALKWATLLMRKLNISRADVLLHSPDGQKVLGGHSVVSIRRRDGNAALPIMLNYWAVCLANAMDCFFGVKSYTTKYKTDGRTTHVMVTFYGIAENTCTAARAYEMVFGLINMWARKYTGKEYKLRNSYCRGVCRGLKKCALSEKKEEETASKEAEEKELARRVEQEEADRQAELKRLKNPHVDTDSSDADTNLAFTVPSSAGDRRISSILDPGYRHVPDPTINAEASYEDFASDNEQDNLGDGSNHESEEDDIDADEDTEQQGAQNLLTAILSLEPEAPPQSHSSPLDQNPVDLREQSVPDVEHVVEDDAESQWKSLTALIAFRHNEEQIADDYYKEMKGKKLRAGRKSRAKLDAASYECGKQDAKKIDVRQKAIKGVSGGPREENW